MRRLLPIVTSSILLLIAALPVGSASAQEQALPDTIDRIRPSIVGVGTYQKTRRPAKVMRGTGFVVADGRHVLTNAHVLPEKLNERHREMLVVFVGRGRESSQREARILAQDEEHDLALLAIDGEALPAMTLGDSDKVREGELYAFTGFPIGAVLGLYPATHRGIVSAITPIVTPAKSARQLSPEKLKRLATPFDVFQLDATAYPGNSGSPLYHPKTGVVVGVLNMVFVKETKEDVLAKPSGITYAIPGAYARALLSEAGVK